LQYRGKAREIIMTEPVVDPTVPALDQEVGTVFDYAAGELLFGDMANLPPDSGEVVDVKEPNASQMQEMLDNDGRARALEFALVQPILKTGWHLDSDDVTVADWAEEILRRPAHDGGSRTPFDNVIAQKTSAFAFRRSFHEKVFTRAGREVIYGDIAWRPQATCTIIRDKRTGALQGFDQWILEEPDKVMVYEPYASVYIHGVNREPVKGYSDLQVTYRNYRTKEKIKFLWYTYLECLSLPRTILLANSEDGAKKGAKTVAALKNAGVAGVPKEWIDSIKTIDVGAGSAQEFSGAITYLDSDSAESILAGWTGLASAAVSQGVGSRALSTNQSDIFFDLLTAHANELAQHITVDIVADLVRFNKGQGVKVPNFVFDELHRPDVQLSIQLLQSIVTSPSPMMPDEFVKELVTNIARDLGLNVDKITASMTDFSMQAVAAAATPQEAKAAPVRAAADVGAAVVQKALENGAMK
jgi:hypothetical protein